MMTTDKTRWMLHEMAKEIGVTLGQVIEAVHATRLKGHLIGGCRYWTTEEFRTIENWLANS